MHLSSKPHAFHRVAAEARSEHLSCCERFPRPDPAIDMPFFELYKGEFRGKLSEIDSCFSGLPPARHVNGARFERLLSAMGIRTSLIAAAVVLIAVTTVSIGASTAALAQAASRSPAAASASGADANPAATAKPARPASEAQSNRSSQGSFPAVRAPVRREAQPKQRRIVKSRPEPGQSQQPPVQQAAPGVQPAIPATGVAAGTAAGAATAAAATAGPQSAGAANQTAAPSFAWSADEIRLAKAQCDIVLRGVTAAYAAEDPIKQGECGSPVVFKVTSIGKAPEVQLTPPAVMTCEMIASLDKWVRNDVQPQARALLGGAIVKMDTMSSYSCRNAYGRAKTRLSEHGRANALDISGFSTTKENTNVLANWGLTAREQKVLAAKREAERAAAQATPAPVNGQQQNAAPAAPGSGRPPINVPGVIVAPMPGAGQHPGFGFGPVRLGGPKAAGTAGNATSLPDAQAGTRADARQAFLREIHARACKHFGTVLGPEANNAHKNHFHVDMAPRKTTNFCE